MAIRAKYYVWGYVPYEMGGGEASRTIGAELSGLALRTWRWPIWTQSQLGYAALDYETFSLRGGTVSLTRESLSPNISNIIDGDITQVFTNENGYAKECAYGDFVDVDFVEETIPYSETRWQKKIYCQPPYVVDDPIVPVDYSPSFVTGIEVDGFCAWNWGSAQQDVYVDVERGEPFNSTTGKYIGASNFLIGTSFEMSPNYTKGEWTNEILTRPDGSTSSRYRDGANWRVGTAQGGVSVYNCGFNCWRQQTAYATQIRSVSVNPVAYNRTTWDGYDNYTYLFYARISSNANVISSVALSATNGAYSQYYNFFNANGEIQATLNKGWTDLFLAKNSDVNLASVAEEKYGAGAYVETSSVPATSAQYNHGGCPPNSSIAFAAFPTYGGAPELTLKFKMVDRNGDPSILYTMGPVVSLAKTSAGEGASSISDEYGNLEFYDDAVSQRE